MVTNQRATLRGLYQVAYENTISWLIANDLKASNIFPGLFSSCIRITASPPLLAVW
jgi:hypothetical protein